MLINRVVAVVSSVAGKFSHYFLELCCKTINALTSLFSFVPPPPNSPRPNRKSFGTALPAGTAVAASGPSVKGLALTQLYQTVLKMSTENVRLIELNAL